SYNCLHYNYCEKPMFAEAPLSAAAPDSSALTPSLVDQWRAEETAIRARMSAPGLATRDQVAGLTGLQVFEAMFAGRLPPAYIAETLDFSLIEVTFGHAVFQGRPQLRHYNPLGSVHG